jgi:aspartate carbamoyltransferase catalytic subunit
VYAWTIGNSNCCILHEAQLLPFAGFKFTNIVRCFMAIATWTRRHVLSLADFTVAELDTVLQTANSFNEVLQRQTKKVPALQTKLVTTLFFESSTRTRNSFELAAKRLSADVLNFAPGTSSLSKGETILDTAKTFLAMGADMMIVRHKESGVPQSIAAEMDRLGGRVGVLNAGDGCPLRASKRQKSGDRGGYFALSGGSV